MAFKATVLTIFPDMFPGYLGESLVGKGLEQKLWSLEVCNIRDFGKGVHKSVDDSPFGGGPGMVMRPDVLAEAIDSVISIEDQRPKYIMSPRGRQFKQEEAHQLATGDGIVIICGRFEGIDQRVIESRQFEEVSIGDYVLSGGEVATYVLLDAIVRLIPGVLGNPDSIENESFENGLLEHSQYTKPQIWEDSAVPEVLTSGNHAKIKEWQLNNSLELTKSRRPDLWLNYEKKVDKSD